MIRPVQLLAFVSFATLAACAAPPGTSAAGTSAAYEQSNGPQCFLANEVDGYTRSPDGLVNLKVGTDRWFQMQFGSDCPSMDWLMQIAIRPIDSNWLCEGHPSRLIAPDPAGLHRRCAVSGIRRLTPVEIQQASLGRTSLKTIRGE
jgi:hypothetical protein